MACALAVREHPRASASALGAAQLAALPWLSPTLAVPAIGVAVALVSWSARGRGRAGAMLPIEIMLASVVFEATLDEGLYGGLTPSAASVGGAGPALAHRLGRVAGLWIDRDAGLLRWAPALARAAFAGWLLWRSRRAGLARALPARRDAEAAAALALSVCVAQAAVAVLAATPLDPVGFPGASWAPALPAAGALCGWGLRHAPRTGAVLAALTLAASAWLLIALRTGSAPSWDAPPRAPWGPLTDAFPRTGTAASAIVALAALVLLAALAVRERRGARSARFARPA
jgi:hypothetical protein